MATPLSHVFTGAVCCRPLPSLGCLRGFARPALRFQGYSSCTPCCVVRHSEWVRPSFAPFCRAPPSYRLLHFAKLTGQLGTLLSMPTASKVGCIPSPALQSTSSSQAIGPLAVGRVPGALPSCVTRCALPASQLRWLGPSRPERAASSSERGRAMAAAAPPPSAAGALRVFEKSCPLSVRLSLAFPATCRADNASTCL